MQHHPIPDAIRPIIAIGSVLPPFALVILGYLWFKLEQDVNVIGPYMAYSTVSLIPLALVAYIRRAHMQSQLPSSLTTAVIFWALAFGPIGFAMSTLEQIDLQMTLAMPIVVILGFYVSTMVYLVSGLFVVWAKKRGLIA